MIRIFIPLMVILFLSVQEPTVRIARLKYGGGGDWYVSPTALPNLIKFCNETIKTNIYPQEDIVDPSSPEIFYYPLLYMTGHGRVFFTESDIANLRKYLLGGGFLLINDSYGMDPYIRPELKKLFPDRELQPVPITHPIFNEPFKFPNGLPKIHKHSGKPPEALGIFDGNRLMILYVYESDIGDGWEDPLVHNDPPHLREQALKMGANIIHYVFTH